MALILSYMVSGYYAPDFEGGYYSAHQSAATSLSYQNIDQVTRYFNKYSTWQWTPAQLAMLGMKQGPYHPP